MASTTRAEAGGRRRSPAFGLCLPAIIGHHMVLQRDRPAPIWGWAAPGERVTVMFAGRRYRTVADESGRWQVPLDPLPASVEPRPLRIMGERSRGKGAGSAGARRVRGLTVRDVLVGEVWIGSGQSNMGFALEQAANGAREAAAARPPHIRLFQIPAVCAAAPAADVPAHWTRCSPATVGGFSAVLYVMGRQLHQSLRVPVGLIHASWGGSACAPWVPLAALEAQRGLKTLLTAGDAARRDPVRAARIYETALAKWECENVPVDPGGRGFARGWASPAFQPRDWSSLSLPGDWDWDELSVRGALWLRREIACPPDWAGRELTLNLGAVTDRFTVYFNNVQIAAQDHLRPHAWPTMGPYTIPGRLVRAGHNTIAVRLARYLGGGITGPGCDLFLRGPAGVLTLTGRWLAREESAWPAGRTMFAAPMPPLALDPAHGAVTGYPGPPAAMFNGMIAPLIPFAIRGVCWYQGESNVRSAGEYPRLLRALIAGWRRAWNQGAFPFLIVQLANFKSGAAWAELQASQAYAAQTIRRCALVVTNDVGEAHDIHPADKETVGRRLCQAALAMMSGRGAAARGGPVYAGMTGEHGCIRVRFRARGGGLRTRDGGEATGFLIAGGDRRFVPARARLERGTVVVWSPAVRKPAAVRYNWAGNPDGNLVTRAGLPVSCFRTDRWRPDVRSRRPRFS